MPQFLRSDQLLLLHQIEIVSLAEKNTHSVNSDKKKQTRFWRRRVAEKWQLFIQEPS